MFLNVVIKYIFVSVIIFLLQGVNILSHVIIKRLYKDEFKGTYLFQFWGLIVFLIVWYLNPAKISAFSTCHLWNLKNVILILVSVIPSSIIVYKNKVKSNKLLEKVLNGMSMEIPQRLLVQNLFIILGLKAVIYGELTLGIFLNAVIWVQFIIIQQVMINKKVSAEIIPEITASFWFSIWVGILYSITGNIVIAMITHGLQRIVTYLFRRNLRNIGLKELITEKIFKT